MNKAWNIKIDDVPYTIRLKAGSVIVNEEKSKLKSLLTKRGFLESQFSIPVGSRQALLVIANTYGRAKLVIDGKDCATGEDYYPVKVPKWAYVFIVLHFINCINGLLGIILALFGTSCTVSISSNTKFSLPVRILLNIAVLVAAYLIVLGIALALARAAYG